MSDFKQETLPRYQESDGHTMNQASSGATYLPYQGGQSAPVTELPTEAGERRYELGGGDSPREMHLNQMR